MWILCLVALSSDAWAIAYCSLRDPVGAISKMYPGYSSFETYVGTVTQQTREALRERLEFEFHFDEFGRHSLYVVAVDDRPEGLIHTRSELGEWGMDEIVWAMDLDLRLRDFVFQRSRNPSRRFLEAESFKSWLRGKSLDDLLELSGRNASPDRWGLDLPKKSWPLTQSVIRSAAKAILVTGQVWAEDLTVIRATAIAKERFPAAREVLELQNPYDDQTLLRLAEQAQLEESAFAREATRAFSVLDHAGAAVGTILRTDFRAESAVERFWWTLAEGANVIAVQTPAGHLDEELRVSIGRLDRSLEELEACATPGEIALLEVKLLAGQLSPPPAH
jgi:hypothetical protein